MTISIIFCFLALCFSSCESFTVTDVSLQVKPYDESDRGKFWNLCVNYNEIGSLDKPKVEFEIKAKDSDFPMHYTRRLREKCEKFNVLVVFTNRQTPHSEWEWLRRLEADDIEYINVKVLKDNGFIVFKKTFTSEDLK